MGPRFFVSIFPINLYFYTFSGLLIPFFDHLLWTFVELSVKIDELRILITLLI